AANTWLMTCTRQLTSQSASGAVSCPLRDSPALEKNTSTGPYLSSAAAISALMSSSWPTSQVTATPSISPATFAIRSRDRLADAAGSASDDADLVFDEHVLILTSDDVSSGLKHWFDASTTTV